MKNKECGKCGGFNDINNNNKHSISFKSDASLRFHDVVWWLTKYFGKIVAATITFFSHFSARPRGNKNAATIPSATLLLLPMVLVE